MTETFVDPQSGSGEKVEWKEHVGQLVIVEPTGMQHGVVTENGTADAVVADVSFLDAPGGVEEVLGTWIFSTAIKGKVENHIGSKVLGRLALVNSKQGRQYVDMQPATEQDKANAGAYITARNQARQSEQFASPAPQQPPAQQPAQAQAAPAPAGQVPYQPQGPQQPAQQAVPPY